MQALYAQCVLVDGNHVLIAIRASMPPMMSIFIFFFIMSVHFINKVVSVNVNDCEQLWFDPVA